MYAQYRHESHNILSDFLERELDGFLVDAFANLMSRPIELGWVRTNKTILEFLNTYRCRLATQQHILSVKELPPSCVRWMAAYHLLVAEPLVQQYVPWALSEFEKGLGGPDGFKGHKLHKLFGNPFSHRLSRSEEIHVYRALYRHETYNHLFGQNMGYLEGVFSGQQTDRPFFDLFELWEVEAISCLDTYVRQQWECILKNTWDNLYSENINWRQWWNYWSRGWIIQINRKFK